jgi:pyruvate formate lyase activating enzyme
VKIRVGGYVDISTIDWYGHVTQMIFTASCNFRCPYCQNASLIPANSGAETETENIKTHIKQNINFIDAVGFSGGEPSLQPEPVTEICSWAKKVGLKTFLNTNGTNPTLIKELLEKKLIDCIALSVIAPLNAQDYSRVSGRPDIAESAVENVKKTIHECLNSNIFFETRTTIVPNLVDEEKFIASIAKSVKGCKAYVLQQFNPTGDILDLKLKNINPPKRDTLLKLAKVALKQGIEEVRVRTREFGEEKIQL